MGWKQEDLSKKVYISMAEIADENNRTSFGKRGLFICGHNSTTYLAYVQNLVGVLKDNVKNGGMLKE